MDNFEYHAKEFRIFIWYWVVIEDFWDVDDIKWHHHFIPVCFPEAKILE